MSTMKVAGQMTAKIALFQNHKYFLLLIASIALSLMAEKVKQKGCNFRQCLHRSVCNKHSTVECYRKYVFQAVEILNLCFVRCQVTKQGIFVCENYLATKLFKIQVLHSNVLPFQVQ